MAEGGNLAAPVMRRGARLQPDQTGRAAWRRTYHLGPPQLAAKDDRAGGVDTTTSQTALTLLHLGTHPELRQQLIDHPELYRTATDEFLRYFSVNQQLSRTVTRDATVGGQQLRRNDRVVISWLAANHDEQEFEHADEVVLDRTPNRHLAFGLGPHRCIGSHLARLMSEVMVRAVLARIPDYQVDLDGVYQYRGNPSMTGLGELPVTFTPVVSRGTSQP